MTENEFFKSFEEKLNEQYSFADNLDAKRASEVQVYLHEAAAAFAKLGLRKEAKCIIEISSQLKNESTEDLTSEKMLSNLAENGWVFNADDHDVDACMAEDCMYCLESVPKLSVAEVKRLRALLK